MNAAKFETRNTCPACGSQHSTRLVSIPYSDPRVDRYLSNFYSSQGRYEPDWLEGAYYTLMRCEDCQLLYQQQVPNDALMERLYETWIDPQIVLAEHRAASHRYHAELFHEVLRVSRLQKRPLQDQKFLDFGMGWGTWAIMAGSLGIDSAGLELSASRIRHVQQFGVRILTPEDLQHERFTFINTEQVFEHLPQPLETLKLLTRALEPNGVIKISVPRVHDPARRIRLMDWEATKGQRNSLNFVAPLEHINYFRRDSVLRMAELAGLRQVHMSLRHEYVHAPLVGEKWSTTLRNLARPFLRKAFENYFLFTPRSSGT